MNGIAVREMVSPVRDRDPSPSFPVQVRSIFMSDAHLGSVYSHGTELLEFLRSHHADHLYLVGDIVDGWALRRRWRWGSNDTQILQQLLRAAESGTNLYYAPGNHDEFLRSFLRDFGFVHVSDEFRHRTVDGRDYLVVHGDQFDRAVSVPGWLGTIGSAAYDLILAMNGGINSIRRRLGLTTTRWGLDVRCRIGWATDFVSRWEEAAAEYARQRGCDGVVCGHVHTPRFRKIAECDYWNIGDWMESCSALVEDHDGTFRHVCVSSPVTLTQDLTVHRHASKVTISEGDCPRAERDDARVPVATSY